MSLMETLLPGRKNIVILGAGFGGITAILRLHRLLKQKGLLKTYTPVLVDRNAYHLYTATLYEIAAIPRGEASASALKSTICIQVSDVIDRFPEIHFIGERVQGLDAERRTITFTSGNELAFEYVVVALGAEINFFGIPGLSQSSHPLKTFEDAVRLRNHVEGVVAKKPEVIRIIVGGGGATGVELSAEFMNFLSHVKKQSGAESSRVELTIIEAGPEILGGFDPNVIKNVRRRLQSLGITMLTASPIGRVTESAVILNSGRAISFDILIWSGGVKPASAIANFGLPLDKRGGIVVNEFLEAKPRIYAIGDSASFMNATTGKPLPGNVPVAESGAHIVAENIVAQITGRTQTSLRPLTHYPFILAVGGKYAVADLGAIKFFGFLGWVLKQLVELRYLLVILPFKKAITMWLRSVYYTSAND